MKGKKGTEILKKTYTEGDLKSIRLNRNSKGVGDRGWVCVQQILLFCHRKKITKGGDRDHTPVHNIII